MNRKQNTQWTPPRLDIASIKTGDMPGDKVTITESHIKKSNTIFPYILQELNKHGSAKMVISVYGGSGVGKSEIGSVLGHYLNLQNYPAYILSGDNYPHRIPKYNDMERLLVHFGKPIKTDKTVNFKSLSTPFEYSYLARLN